MPSSIVDFENEPLEGDLLFVSEMVRSHCLLYTLSLLDTLIHCYLSIKTLGLLYECN